MSLHRLAVGQPYDPRRRSWPDGAADYRFRCGAHELRIFLAAPSAEELAAIESGPVEFGLLAEAKGLCLVTRFGRTLSFDTTYSWHRVDPAERVPPPPHEETSPEVRAMVTIILVDASTGLVRALRGVSYSPEFTRAIHRAIADQAASPFDPAAHERWAAALLRHTTGRLWDRTAIRCRGGD